MFLKKWCWLQNQNKNKPIKLNVVNNANGSQGNIQLVVDSRMGVILGPVAQPQGKKCMIIFPFIYDYLLYICINCLIVTYNKF